MPGVDKHISVPRTKRNKGSSRMCAGMHRSCRRWRTGLEWRFLVLWKGGGGGQRSPARCLRCRFSQYSIEPRGQRCRQHQLSLLHFGGLQINGRSLSALVGAAGLAIRKKCFSLEMAFDRLTNVFIGLEDYKCWKMHHHRKFPA